MSKPYRDKYWFPMTLLACGLVFSELAAAENDAGDNEASRSPAVGTQGMVASAHPLATEAGLNVLQNGGNAFDAFVAVATTLNVVEPQNSGIGGYGLILIYDAEKGEVRALNTSGRFPKDTESDVFRAPTPDYKQNRKSAKAISTPTNLNGYHEIHSAYGTKPWADLFESAIRHAEQGHAVNRSVAGAITSGFDEFSDYSKSFYGKDGQPLVEGDVLVQQDLADTLRVIAQEGPDVYYGGAIGKDVVSAVQEAGGFLTMTDLLENEAEWWEPIHINYRGYEVYAPSPPANSFSSLLRLGMMQQFDVAALGHNTVDYLHTFAEVTKHAFWCRLRYAGDPGVKPPPLDRLLSEPYWVEQTAKIDPNAATIFEPPGIVEQSGAHTTHFVVADKLGNIVCATQTLGGGFGSRVMVPGRGFWLNNSMYFCTFEPKGNPMDAHAGRRKLISNHPTIIFRDGQPTIAIGTPGGHTIGQTVPQMVMNMIDFGMDVQASIAAPRVAFTEPNYLNVEPGISGEVQDGLWRLGHEIKADSRIGNAHGLTIEYSDAGKPVRFTGGSDPRGAGMAKGF